MHDFLASITADSNASAFLDTGCAMHKSAAATSKIKRFAPDICNTHFPCQWVAGM
eukprot:m.544696 g.544696  ORF g.544696 m.544696 type:complete len:55 (-) comp22140_c0_seq4:4-168(-)